MNDKKYKIITGDLIRDGDKIGIIYREIKSGTWTEEPLFNWRTNYEIFYDDGTVCVIERGRIELIKDSEK